MYKPKEYDLAGFCVGIVDRAKIIDGSSIKNNDIILGLASNGLHSNGYSLVRKALSKRAISRLKAELLKPTRLYTQPLLDLGQKIKINGIAHVTGGAYVDKIPRIIPDGLSAQIDKDAWPVPEIFRAIQQAGNIKEQEMYHVFNMGIGMAVVISPKDLRKAQAIFKNHKIRNWVIGKIVKGSRKVTLI